MKTKRKVQKKNIKKKHRHTWISDNNTCPMCGYYEECCKKCFSCRDGNTKEIVSE